MYECNVGARVVSLVDVILLVRCCIGFDVHVFSFLLEGVLEHTFSEEGAVDCVLAFFLDDPYLVILLFVEAKRSPSVSHSQ